MIPAGFKYVQILDDVSENDLIGSFLYNEYWGEGGYFNYGDERGFGLSNGAHYNTLTCDSLYDQIIINNFKVYKIANTDN